MILDPRRPLVRGDLARRRTRWRPPPPRQPPTCAPSATVPANDTGSADPPPRTPHSVTGCATPTTSNGSAPASRRLHRLGRSRRQTGRPAPWPPRSLAVDFRLLPATAADEIRIRRRHQDRPRRLDPNASLRRFLIVLVDTAHTRISTSLTERTADDWVLLCRQTWPHTGSYDTLCAPYVRRFFRLLHGATHPDPGTRTTGTGATASSSSSTTPIGIHPHRRRLGHRPRSLAPHRRQRPSLAVNSPPPTCPKYALTHWVRAIRQLGRYLTLDQHIPGPPRADHPVFPRLPRLDPPTRHPCRSPPRQHRRIPAGKPCTTRSSWPTWARRSPAPRRKPHCTTCSPPAVPTGRDRTSRQADRRQPCDRPDPARHDRHHPVGQVLHLRTRRPAHRLPPTTTTPATGSEYWMPKTRSWRRFPIPDTLATVIPRPTSTRA